jgi:hypothetical protein
VSVQLIVSSHADLYSASSAEVRKRPGCDELGLRLLRKREATQLATEIEAMTCVRAVESYQAFVGGGRLKSV